MFQFIAYIENFNLKVFEEYISKAFEGNFIEKSIFTQRETGFEFQLNYNFSIVFNETHIILKYAAVAA